MQPSTPNSIETLLIANVGSRDVSLPPGLIPLDNALRPLQGRPLGEHILSHWDACQKDVILPIFGNALAWIARHHGKVDKVILIATDDNPDPKFRASDTLPFAQVIERILQTSDPWKERIGSGGVEIERFTGNPADYDQVMTFYDTLIRRLSVLAAQQVYLETSGGTPALILMLIIKGVEVFGGRAIPLQVSETSIMPLSLDIGRRMSLDAAARRFESNVTLFQYGAALALLDEQSELLRTAWHAFKAVHALTQHAQHRANFNFELAETALFGADQGLPSTLAEQVRAIVNDMAGRDARWLLREELFASEIDLRLSAYRDAVTNVFAFREALLRQLALQQGTILTSDTKRLELTWLASEPALESYLKAKNIDPTRSVTTFVFERILDYHAKTNPKLQVLIDQIKKLEQLADLRNSATHQHRGVSEASIGEVYLGGVSQLSIDLRFLYENVWGAKIGANPFDGLNNLLLKLCRI